MEKIALDRVTLLDLNGRVVELTTLVHELTLLIFLRHLAWLPCQAHLGEVAEAKSELERRSVPVLVISFAEPSVLASYQERRRWPFALFADPQREAYRAFGLKRFSRFKVFSGPTLMRYFQLLRRGMKRAPHGGDDILQSGGDFLIDRDGTILFAHRSRNPADRPASEFLLREVDRAIAARSSASAPE